MRTFLDIQQAVLTRTGDGDDEDKMRELVKLAINSVNRRVLTERRYQFMIWPKPEGLTLTAGKKAYSLHPQFAQMWYGHNTETEDWMEEIPAGEVANIRENLVTGESAKPYRYFLTGVTNVKMQPTTTGVLVVTTTGGTEDAANQILVKGVSSSGEYIEETLTTGSAWSTLTSSTIWKVIEAITKIGGTFTRTITCTVGSDIILTLYATEYGRQYRVLEFVNSPTATVSMQYRFYRKIRTLENDYDIPQIPDEYTDILVYGALLDLQGFARPDPGELEGWKTKVKDLTNQLQQQFQQSRSVNGRANYINHTPR